MKNLILILLISQINFCVNSQSDGEKILNIVLDNATFLNHVTTQEIIDLEQVNYLIPNNFTDSSWEIVFQNKQINFNTEFFRTSKGFDDGYDLEVISLQIRKKTANITLRFFPTWNPCSDDDFSSTRQTQSLFMDLTASFQLENNEWVLSELNIFDDSFESQKEKYTCIVNNYKRIKGL